MHFPEGLEDTSLKSCKSHETIAMKLHSYVETNEIIVENCKRA